MNKFRVWDIARKEWREFDNIYIDQDGEVWEIEEATWAYQTYMKKDNLTNNSKIVWSTGCNDIKDKEIFQNDIVLCECSGLKGYEIRIICYDTNQAKYKSVPIITYKLNAGNGSWTGYGLTGFEEVIGSTFTHPELLETT